MTFYIGLFRDSDGELVDVLTCRDKDDLFYYAVEMTGMTDTNVYRRDSIDDLCDKMMGLGRICEPNFYRRISYKEAKAFEREKEKAEERRRGYY